LTSMIRRIISSLLSMSRSKQTVTIQLRQRRHRYVTDGTYQANGRTPLVRGGGGQRSMRSGTRGATTSGEKSGEGRQASRWSQSESKYIVGVRRCLWWWRRWRGGRRGRRGVLKERKEKQRDRVWSLTGGYPRHFLLRPTPPQRPLCRGDGLGASDNILDCARQIRLLGRAHEKGQTSRRDWRCSQGDCRDLGPVEAEHWWTNLAGHCPCLLGRGFVGLNCPYQATSVNSFKISSFSFKRENSKFQAGDERWTMYSYFNISRV
jgi:hypothetical protein